MISEIYHEALDYSILPEQFWNYSLAEIKDLIESRQRVKIQEVKERVSISYELAGLIGVYMNKMFDQKDEIQIPHPWDTYPELFRTEKERYQRKQIKEQLEAAKAARREYAYRHNRMREKAGLI